MGMNRHGRRRGQNQKGDTWKQTYVSKYSWMLKPTLGSDGQWVCAQRIDQLYYIHKVNWEAMSPIAMSNKCTYTVGIHLLITSVPSSSSLNLSLYTFTKQKHSLWNIDNKTFHDLMNELFYCSSTGTITAIPWTARSTCRNFVSPGNLYASRTLWTKSSLLRITSTTRPSLYVARMALYRIRHTSPTWTHRYFCCHL